MRQTICFRCGLPKGTLDTAGLCHCLITDLRSICRDSDMHRTTVSLEERGTDGYAKSQYWFIAGASNLRPYEGNRRPDLWILDARLGKGPIFTDDPSKQGVATDFEEDAGYAYELPLIGVNFDQVREDKTIVTAYVDPDAIEDGGFSNFRVPEPGYNPFEDAEQCTRCPDEDEEPHWIIPEGMFKPPTLEDLYQRVRARKVEIIFWHGPVPEDEPGKLWLTYYHYTNPEGSRG